jgi:hypothetical protein
LIASVAPVQKKATVGASSSAGGEIDDMLADLVSKLGIDPHIIKKLGTAGTLR